MKPNMPKWDPKRHSDHDDDGWPVGHLCMEPMPGEDDVFCRKREGHLEDGEKHAPAMSDIQNGPVGEYPGPKCPECGPQEE